MLRVALHALDGGLTEDEVRLLINRVKAQDPAGEGVGHQRRRGLVMLPVWAGGVVCVPQPDTDSLLWCLSHEQAQQLRHRSADLLGRWQARYRGPDGKRRPAPRPFGTRREAERWLADMDRQIERGEYRDPALLAVRLEE